MCINMGSQVATVRAQPIEMFVTKSSGVVVEFIGAKLVKMKTKKVLEVFGIMLVIIFQVIIFYFVKILLVYWNYLKI